MECIILRESFGRDNLGNLDFTYKCSSNIILRVNDYWLKYAIKEAEPQRPCLLACLRMRPILSRGFLRHVGPAADNQIAHFLQVYNFEFLLLGHRVQIHVINQS
jgi:hypothetical protein